MPAETQSPHNYLLIWGTFNWSVGTDSVSGESETEQHA